MDLLRLFRLLSNAKYVWIQTVGDIITSEYICVDASAARAHVIPNQDLMSIKFYANRRAALRSGRS